MKPSVPEMSSIDTAITELVAQITRVDPSTLHGATRLREDLRFDSLDAVKLLVAIEDRWRIVISDAEVASIHTLDDLLTHVHRSCSQT